MPKFLFNMINSIPFITRAFCLFIWPTLFAFSISATESSNRADIEYGMVWQGKNAFQIPNAVGGTRIDLASDSSTAESILVNRFYFTHTLNGPHQIKILFAPLELRTSGTLKNDFYFQNQLFHKDELAFFIYKFNSYRLSYIYNIKQNESWSWNIGVTAKIRDAKISVRGKDKVETKKDLGFVPLLHFGFNYTPQLIQNIELEFDADALAAPQGRAEDLSFKLSYLATEQARFYLGYRVLEGGADNKAVYTFALFHYLIAGMKFDF